jgi:hypothetical protein
LNRPEDDFWNSSLAKIFALIDIHIEAKYTGQKESDITISSMKDIPGW